jgi:hypothetical protein
MRRLFVAIAAAVAMALAVPAGAGTLTDARVGFSADRLLVIDGRSYQGRMWTMPGRERHEQMIKGMQPIFILRAASPLGEVVLPNLHTVFDFVFPAELRVLADKRLTRHPVGRDIVNGIETTRYAVDETVPEGRAVGEVWISPDGIPMRLAGNFTKPNGKSSTFRWELSHVRIGPQPAALFEPPPGYSHLPAEALAPLLGLKLKSARH